jgi:uncharacterized membrane protein YgaE (UPF0421/DUF939 family)
MEAFGLVRYILLFVIFSVSLALNLDDNVIARLGFSGNYGFILALALICTMFVAGRHAVIVATVVVLCLNANMPIDFSLNFGYDRDYYAGLMAALVLQPILMRMID